MTSKRDLHVVMIEWEQYSDKPMSYSIGYLVAETKTGILLAGTYDEEADLFPVCYGTPRNKIKSLTTICIFKKKD